jgi:sterol desaturase/sphingolipid hydroxylase (fatty acid hydroxylase superfamily)
MPYASYLYAATAIIFLCEILAGRHRNIYSRADWWVTLGCISTSLAVTRPLAALLIAWVIGLALPAWRGILAGTDPILAFIAVFFATEFAFYWVHRWAHEAQGKRHSWLWKLHRTHHSGKYMNVTVTLRVNPFWSFVVSTPWVLAVATYLGLGQAAGYTILIIYGWNLITHAHFRWDDAIRRHRTLGPGFRALEHILVSPGMHHSHHGYGKDGGNFRNYAVTLALWDWMFGTLYIPDGRPWKYGVPGPNPPWSEEVLFPLVGSGAARVSAEGDAG